jgi:glucan phosphoethanolaminetransferase (alkaline phosphatase superfamily)
MKEYFKFLGVGILYILLSLIAAGFMVGLLIFWMWVFRPLDNPDMIWTYVSSSVFATMVTILLIMSPFAYMDYKKNKDKWAK